MESWPQVTEPDLANRQRMSDEEFLELWNTLAAAVGTRELDDEHYERAIGYPWARPSGSYLVSDEGFEELAGIELGRRQELIELYTDASSERVPLLAYGANGAPERLGLKFAHLPEDHREALIVAGYLNDFDIGAAAHPPIWSSMPATPIPSPGTEVCASILYLTSVQFTALWWTELSYRVGALDGVRVTTDVLEKPVERVLLFVSRFGAFCVDGAPVAMSALPARNRRSTELSQAEILDAAARLSLGEGSTARDLIKGAFENPAAFMAAHYPSFRAASLPFESERWTELPVSQPA